ncbi:unnamed protein product [Rhodiola kirilowii]
MDWGVDILSSPSRLGSSSWLFETSGNCVWTNEENKLFENALALYDKDTPDRWAKVAAMIPGKSVSDVIKQYQVLEEDIIHIEAGRIPIPGYNNSSNFTMEWMDDRDFDGLKQFYGSGMKRCSTNRGFNQEKKKGVPWTEAEHRQFLMGLKKYGKGDWRNIARNFVTTRTPTQVASHAQKYFIRQLNGGKDRRRSSIHDITVVNLVDRASSSLDTKKASMQDQPPSVMTLQQHSDFNSMTRAFYNQKVENHETLMVFDSTSGNSFIAPPYGSPTYEHNLLEQAIPQRIGQGSQCGAQTMLFHTPMQHRQ